MAETVSSFAEIDLRRVLDEFFPEWRQATWRLSFGIQEVENSSYDEYWKDGIMSAEVKLVEVYVDGRRLNPNTSWGWETIEELNANYHDWFCMDALNKRVDFAVLIHKGIAGIMKAGV